MDEVIRRGSARTFFCGYFNWSKKVEEALGKKYPLGENGNEVGWTRQILNKSYKTWCPELDGQPGTVKDYDFWCGFYYEAFVESLLDKDMNEGKRNDLYNDTAHWILGVSKGYCDIGNDTCPLVDFCSVSSMDHRFAVDRLHLFRFPFGKCIFAIELHEPDVNLNTLTLVHGKIREVNSYNDKVFGLAKFPWAETFLKAVAPLKEMSPDGDYTGWVERGAKLKAFQIVKSDYIGDDLLYELGTMSKIGIVRGGAGDKFSPSGSYYELIMRDNKISAFRTWTALALLDTVTVVGKDTDRKGNGLDKDFIWATSYFRMIYVHALYQKLLLFDVNKSFRDPESKNNAVDLVDKVKDIERYYAFPTISYNFLPQLIYEKIKFGLEVDKEREQIHRYVEQEGKRQDEKNDKMLSNAITGLTFITLGSVFFDVTSLVVEMRGVTSQCGYNHVASWVIGVITCVIILLFWRYICDYMKKVYRWFVGLWKK